MARLLSLDTKIFGGEPVIQPEHVTSLVFSFDQGGGVYLELTLLSGHNLTSYRHDAGDSGTVAKLKAYRDGLMDRINSALVEDAPTLPSPATPEARKL